MPVIIAFFIGGFFGFFACALIVAAKDKPYQDHNHSEGYTDSGNMNYPPG